MPLVLRHQCSTSIRITSQLSHGLSWNQVLVVFINQHTIYSAFLLQQNIQMVINNLYTHTRQSISHVLYTFLQQKLNCMNMRWVNHLHEYQNNFRVHVRCHQKSMQWLCTCMCINILMLFAQSFMIHYIFITSWIRDDRWRLHNGFELFRVATVLNFPVVICS